LSFAGVTTDGSTVILGNTGKTKTSAMAKSEQSSEEIDAMRAARNFELRVADYALN
jgi:hypothetical protein